jgi:cytochrome c biogenesis protein CcdA
MTAGFTLVFGAFGLIVAPLAQSVERWLPWATVVIGLVLLALGGRLLTGRELTLRLPKCAPRPARPTRPVPWPCRGSRTPSRRCPAPSARSSP